MTKQSLTTMPFSPNASTTFNIRVAGTDGARLFIARDVCSALDVYLRTRRGYIEVNTSRLRASLGNDEITHIHGVGNGGSGLLAISESGLYKLIMRSDKPEARKFQDWVTREVLPAIRKTGGYLLNEEARDTAKADDRQGMPLPEAFVQVLQEFETTT